LARGLTPGATDFDPTEQIVQRKVALAEAITMATKGDIVDGLTLIAIHRLARLIGE
jgi:hypothetical protein